MFKYIGVFKTLRYCATERGEKPSDSTDVKIVRLGSTLRKQYSSAHFSMTFSRNSGGNSFTAFSWVVEKFSWVIIKQQDQGFIAATFDIRQPTAAKRHPTFDSRSSTVECRALDVVRRPSNVATATITSTPTCECRCSSDTPGSSRTDFRHSYLSLQPPSASGHRTSDTSAHRFRQSPCPAPQAALS